MNVQKNPNVLDIIFSIIDNLGDDNILKLFTIVTSLDQGIAPKIVEHLLTQQRLDVAQKLFTQLDTEYNLFRGDINVCRNIMDNWDNNNKSDETKVPAAECENDGIVLAGDVASANSAG